MASKGLSLEVMWQAKQMYEERDELGRRKYSMLEVAAHFGISETSVLRAVKNLGRFANMHNKPLPEIKTEEQMSEEAKSSYEKLQELLKKEREERQPGTNKSDRMVTELKEGASVAEQAAFYTGRPLKGEENVGRDEAGTGSEPTSPLDE